MRSSNNAVCSITLIILFMLASLPVHAAGDIYSSSVSGLLTTTDYDDDTEFTGLLAGFQLFHDPVSLDKGPYEEASFLDRQSNISVAISSDEYDLDGETTDGNSFFFTYEFAEQSQPVTFGFLYATSNSDGEISGIAIDTSIDILTFQLGYYLNTHSRLLFDISQLKTETTLDNVFTIDADADSYSLEYKNVSSLGDNRAVNAEIGFGVTDNDGGDQASVLSLELDYYLSKAASIIIGLEQISSDDSTDEGKEFSFGALAFIQKMTSIGIMLESFSANEPGNDNNTIQLTLEHRIN